MSALADFVVDRTTPTPPQFDTSISVATMAAIQRALGNYQGGGNFTTSQTLTAASAGKTSFFNSASPLSCVLPLLSTVPVGAAFPVENGGSGVLTLSSQGGDALYFLGSAVNGSKTLGSGDTAHVVDIGTGSWAIIGGSIQHGSSATYGSSLAASGYQKFPSGLIVQWATVGGIAAAGTLAVTFPIAFTSVCYGVLATPMGSAQGTIEMMSSLTTSGCTLGEGGGSKSITGAFYVAIGK